MRRTMAYSRQTNGYDCGVYVTGAMRQAVAVGAPLWHSLNAEEPILCGFDPKLERKLVAINRGSQQTQSRDERAHEQDHELSAIPVANSGSEIWSRFAPLLHLVLEAHPWNPSHNHQNGVD